MRNMWIIARREYGHYFISPIAYAVAFLLFLIVGIIFGLIKTQAPNAPADLQGELGSAMTIFLFMTPALTMRLLADEQRSGTMELLLTGPIRAWEIVVGKWLGAWLFTWTLLLFLAFVYGSVLTAYGNPDYGVLTTSFIGLGMVLGALLALGIIGSAVTSNLVGAMIIGLTINLFLWMFGFAMEAVAGWFSTIDWVQKFSQYMNFTSHLENFQSGVFASIDFAFYVSIIAVSLYLTTRLVESRRWR
ncbi:MAG TPA: ABC transporter permease [Anaerolineales bacterium]|nr:ABC transporter permease [Anaerolineales bacterium]